MMASLHRLPLNPHRIFLVRRFTSLPPRFAEQPSSTPTPSSGSGSRQPFSAASKPSTPPPTWMRAALKNDLSPLPSNSPSPSHSLYDSGSPRTPRREAAEKARVKMNERYLDMHWKDGEVEGKLGEVRRIVGGEKVEEVRLASTATPSVSVVKEPTVVQVTEPALEGKMVLYRARPTGLQMKNAVASAAMSPLSVWLGHAISELSVGPAKIWPVIGVAIAGFGQFLTYTSWVNLARTVETLSVPIGTTRILPTTPLTLTARGYHITRLRNVFPPTTYEAKDLFLQGEFSSDGVVVAPKGQHKWILGWPMGSWGANVSQELGKGDMMVQLRNAFETNPENYPKFLQYNLRMGFQYNAQIVVTKVLGSLSGTKRRMKRKAERVRKEKMGKKAEEGSK